MKKIIVEFSGWIEVNENTKFSHIETLTPSQLVNI